MTILEFIESRYPIIDKIKQIQSDPRQKIMASDDLPYDYIGPDEDGKITKMVEIDDTRSISVMELLALTEDDVNKSDDEALKLIWSNYMSQVDVTALTVEDILASVRHYYKGREEELAKLNVLRL